MAFTEGSKIYASDFNDLKRDLSGEIISSSRRGQSYTITNDVTANTSSITADGTNNLVNLCNKIIHNYFSSVKKGETKIDEALYTAMKSFQANLTTYTKYDIQYSTNSYGGSAGCDNHCTGLCSGCSGGCTGNCTDSCAQGCNSNCSGTCEDTCLDTCDGDCKGECGNTCTNGCTDGCSCDGATGGGGGCYTCKGCGQGW